MLLFTGHLTGLTAPAEIIVYVDFKFGHNVRLYHGSDHYEKSDLIRNGFDF